MWQSSKSLSPLGCIASRIAAHVASDFLPPFPPWFVPLQGHERQRSSMPSLRQGWPLP